MRRLYSRTLRHPLQVFSSGRPARVFFAFAHINFDLFQPPYVKLPGRSRVSYGFG